MQQRRRARIEHVESERAGRNAVHLRIAARRVRAGVEDDVREERLIHRDRVVVVRADAVRLPHEIPHPQRIERAEDERLGDREREGGVARDGRQIAVDLPRRGRERDREDRDVGDGRAVERAHPCRRLVRKRLHAVDLDDVSSTLAGAPSTTHCIPPNPITRVRSREISMTALSGPTVT
jgi:hypothetical protein